MHTTVSPTAHRAKASGDTAAMLHTFDEFFAAWNKHNVNEMLSYWDEDASLINPVGRAASGKAEIEKILADEQATTFRDSHARILSLTSKPLTRDLAWFDGEMTIDHALDRNGAAMPQMKVHIAGLMKKKGGHWLIHVARPYAFASPERAH